MDATRRDKHSMKEKKKLTLQILKLQFKQILLQNVNLTLVAPQDTGWYKWSQVSLTSDCVNKD